MDRAVEAVRTCIVDDVHVGIRFADLLETLSSRIRSSFVRMSSGNGIPASRAQSRSPGLTAAAMAMAPMGPPPAPASSGSMNNKNNNNHNNSALFAASQPSSWTNNVNANNGIGAAFPYISPNSPSLTAGRMTPSHPLYGISTEPYDPGTGNVSIMPPPSFPIYNSNIYDSNNPATGEGGGLNVIGTPGATGLPDDGNGNGDGGVPSGQGGAGPDWLALPLDPLLNSYGADVTQTTYGPDVGGFDLLDLLLGNLNNA